MLFQWSSPQSVVKDAVDTSPKSKSAKVLFRGQVDNVSIFCPGMSLDKVWFSNYSMYMTCWHLLGEGSLVTGFGVLGPAVATMPPKRVLKEAISDDSDVQFVATSTGFRPPAIRLQPGGP